MSTQIILDPKEYGIEESKAVQIAAQFKPMLEKMVELENEFNDVILLEPTKENCALAKELRLKYVKVRTGTAEIHKNQKAFYLAAGRYIDGWKNAQLFASEGIEGKLSERENHFENLEKLRISELQNKRQNDLIPFGIDGFQMALGTMPDEVWNNYFIGSKLGYEQRIAAEKKAEEDRIAAEKAEADERERIRIENERLKKDAEEKERQIQSEREEAEAKLKLQSDAAEKLRIEAETKARLEREEIEAKAKTQRELAAEIQRQQQAEIERQKAVLKAKEDAEIEAKKEAELLVQSELSKGDKEKFDSLILDLESLKTKYSFKSTKYKNLKNSVNELIDKTVNYAISII